MTVYLFSYCRPNIANSQRDNSLHYYICVLGARYVVIEEGGCNVYTQRRTAYTKVKLVNQDQYMGIGQIRRHIGDANLAGNY